MKKIIKKFINDVFYSFLTSITFLFRFKISSVSNFLNNKNKYNYTYFSFFMPIIGLILSLFLILFFNLIIFINKNILFNDTVLIVFFIIIFQYIISNLFHFDGFVDTLDAIFVFKPINEKLNILKDVHIGSFALWGTIIYLFLKLYLLFKGIKLNVDYIVPVFLFPVAGRLSASFISTFFKPAKKEGLSALIGKFKLIQVVISLLFILFIIYFICTKNPFKTIYIMLISIIVNIIFCTIIIKKNFDGITGDLIGFSVETGEVLYLFIFYVFM